MASKTSDLVFNLIGHDKTGPATKSAASNLDHVSKAASNMGKMFAGVAAGAGLAVLGKQALDFATDSVAAFTTVGKEAGSLQRLMGGTIEEASSMRGMFKLAGVDAEQAGKSMGIFSKSIVNNGEAFAGMGVAVRDAGGQLRPTNDILKDTAERFKAMPNGAAKTALAMELFGKSGTSMLPFLNRGAEGLAELEKKTADYGLTLSKVDQEAIGGAIKAQRELDMAMEGAKVTLGAGLAPLFTEAKTQMAEMAVPLTQALIPGFQAIGDVALLALTQIRDNMPAVQAGVAEFAGGIRGVSESIRDNWPQIVETVETLGSTLQRVGQFTQGVWDAFQSLPDGVKQTLLLAAVAQKTGALAITFKAVDIVKSLFSSTVPVMNVGKLTAAVSTGGIGPGAAVPVVGAGSKAATAAALFSSVSKIGIVGAVTVVGTQILIDNADKLFPKAQADYGKSPTVNTGGGIATPANFAGLDPAIVQQIKDGYEKAYSPIREAHEEVQKLNRAAAMSAPTGIENITLAMTSLGLQSGVSSAEIAAVNQVVTAMPPGTEASVLAAAIQSVGTAAGLTQPEIDAMTAAATGVPAGENVAALGLRIASVGAQSGVSEDAMLTLNTAIASMPPGTTAEQLRVVIQTVGQASGLTQEQIDLLSASVNAVPPAANLPALTMAIAVAGQNAGLSTEQVDAMSAAVAAVPPGATAAQMGEALRIAGEKAGLTDAQIQGVTTAVNNVPPTKGVAISTNAPGETDKVNALQLAINSLEGKTINVGMSISGSTGGGTGGSVYSGGAAGISPWVNGQVDDLAKSLAPKLLAAGDIGSGPWVKPVGSYVVSSEWMRGGGEIHYGIDLAAAMGTPVHSASAGIVTQAGWNNGYGNFIAVDHGNVVTTYSHLSAILAAAGQAVGAGAIIGAVGSTGDSTGPHLHFETRPGDNPVEPRAFMAARGVYLASGGMVPVNVSNGEYFVPASKAKKHMPLLHALNAGRISGPGTGTSDSIRGAAAPGAFVVNAAATVRHRALLDRISRGSGRSQYLAGGGVVGGGGFVAGGTRVQLLIDGRALHESLIRYQRESGTVDLFPART